MVGDGGGEMGLAAAAGAGKDQPPFRVVGKRAGRGKGPVELLPAGRIFALAFGEDTVEGQAGEGAEVAVPLQAGLTFSFLVLLSARAGNDTTVIRLSCWQQGMKKPQATPAKKLETKRKDRA